MTDLVKHECGIAVIRLLKPLEYYHEKYGTWRWGLNKLYLLMEKQHNRGQDGAGVVSIKFDLKPGKPYLFRHRSNSPSSINDVFGRINDLYNRIEEKNPEYLDDPAYARDNIPFAGEIYLGHLRYGTFGNSTIDHVHPVMRENNWKSRNLVLAGNFNLTNTDELFNKLIELGQHPKAYSDTVTILEKVGHFLDEENQFLFRKYKNEGYTNQEISGLIESNLDVHKVLEDSSKDWDGGYTVAGIIGHGDIFVARDPWGIRPAFYYQDDEVVIVASERPVIQTVMNVPIDQVRELDPGNALLVKKDGRIIDKMIRVPHERLSCSFERIYFSRGSDSDIYRERKKLGELLTPQILKAIDNDLVNTVFSYIPNTAESAFYGMVKGIENYMLEEKTRTIIEKGNTLSEKEMTDLIAARPRVEKIAIKDVKLRTFISQEKDRDDLAGHVYDITYGTIREGVDNLVIIDDSIVRGTTLKKSILKILDRLSPKKIVIVSSSPQIRYPDCYGIDMTKLGDFVAFHAAIELLKDTGREKMIMEIYKLSKEQQNLPREQIVNYVKEIYKPFTAEEISAKISALLKPSDLKAEVEIVYQTIGNLHAACPNDKGDWYFTGNYPTPGGNKVVNTSYVNFIESRNQRSY
ncbi:MAG: amidophosphoribosyltransferase [Bacteroidales bacterium]